MPELPEIETLRLSLEPHLPGRRLLGVTVRDGRLREPVNAAHLQRLVLGRQVASLERRGKYLVIRLQPAGALIIHLGMSGRLLLTSSQQAAAAHEHLVFELEGGESLRFRDPRRFGLVEGLEELAADFTGYRRFQTLGVEPLSPKFTSQDFFARTRKVQKPIKNFLMDGTEQVGVGNIYASEALFVAKVHPKLPAGKLTQKQSAQLVRAVRQVLSKAIALGGTTLNDFQDGEGNSGYFQQKLKVYHRTTQPCKRCQTPIRQLVMAGRSTYFCPICQAR